jgi:dipeptidyl aminopeptidase/acylaminoacyl peptidase
MVMSDGPEPGGARDVDKAMMIRRRAAKKPKFRGGMEKAVGVPYSENPDIYKKVAPMNYVNAGSCPVFHLHAEDEYMFPLRYILEFKAKMEKLGRRCKCKIYTNAEHGFFYDLTRRQQKEAFADILKFIESL